MKKYQITTIGNALLDMEFHIKESFLETHAIEKGLQTLIDQDQLKSLLQALEGKDCLQNAGGACTNSLVAAAQLGAQTFYHCQIGNDAYGDTLINSLEVAKVDTCPLEKMQTPGPTGICIALITPDAERTMLTYLGMSDSIAEANVDFEAIKQSEYFLVEGFQCITDLSRATNQIAMKQAQAAGTKIALSFCDEAVVQYFHPQISELLHASPIDILFCNQHEAMKYTQTNSIEEASEALKNISKSFAMTLGSQGALVFDGQNTFTIESESVQATDTLGAGDLFAGSFLYALTQGKNYEEAGTFANKAAARLVTTFGARLEQAVLVGLYEAFCEEKARALA